MKASYVKPTLKSMEIDAEGSMLAESGENNLLPSRYVPEDAGIGDELDVFIYLDQEERLIATTETPLARSPAQVSPEGPEPTIATLWPFD